MDHKPLEKYKVKLGELELGKSNEYTQIDCPSCSESICAKDINIHDKIAKCDCCDAVFSIQGMIKHLAVNTGPKHAVLRPEGIETFSYGEELELSIAQTFNVLDIISIGFFFFSFLTTTSYLKGKVTNIMVPIILFLIPICYYIFRYARRTKPTTYITVNNLSLTVENKPRTLSRTKVFDVDEIDQIYVQKSEDMGYYNVFVLCNSNNGQTHEKLLTGIKSFSKARYLEQEIEKHLGIEDRNIPEEKH